MPFSGDTGTLPMSNKLIQHTHQQFMDTLDVRVYKGSDGSFNLYNDEGDTYNYEEGVYSIIPFIWNEQDQVFTIRKQQGRYQASFDEQVFNIIWIDETTGLESSPSANKKSVIYNGNKIEVPHP